MVKSYGEVENHVFLEEEQKVEFLIEDETVKIFKVIGMKDVEWRLGVTLYELSIITLVPQLSIKNKNIY